MTLAWGSGLRPLRALVVEDKAADAELLLYHIRKAGFQLTADVVSTPAEMATRLNGRDYDVVVSDFNLGGWSAMEGLELCEALGRKVPFIVVSGILGDVQAVECIKQGATDYVLKDHMAPRLGIAIHRALKEFAAAREKAAVVLALDQSKVALLGAEDRFEKIFRLSPDPTAITVLSTGRFVDVNQAYGRLSGFSREELIGKTGPEIGLWTDLARRESLAAQLKRNGRVRHLEQEFRVKSGRLRLTTYSAELIQVGGETYALEVVRDITDKQAIETRLRLSSKILNAIANLVLVANENGHIIYASPSVQPILGYRPDEVLGDKWWEATSGEKHKSLMKERIVGFAKGESAINSMPTDQLIKHRDGTLRCILWQNSKSDGLTIMVGQDITELKLIEQALRTSQDRYRILFDRNPQPMYVHDVETLQFLDVNDAALQKYGYSRQEFLAMTTRDIRPPEELPKLLAEIELAKAAEVYRSPELWKHRSKSGELMDMEVAAHQVTLSGRKAMLVLTNDVTDQRRMQRQLQQVQNMEAVGQLAGGIAHDFNNLLSIIMGQAELLMIMDKPQAPLRVRAEAIIKAAERGASLTGQLLAFSRKQTLNPAAVALNDLVRETTSLLGRTIGEHIKVDTKLSKDLWATKVDPGQVQEVILNLAINARDAMPNGGRLTFETSNVAEGDMKDGEAEAPQGDHVCLSISDNGIGMTEEIKTKIFEPFFTTKEEGKGTGLGLAMVYGIVKQSGGQIEVSSEVGKGTSFKLYFPRTMSTVLAPEARFIGATGGTETVLVVEDQESFREVMVDVLEGHGYTVIEASNGKTALEKIKEHGGDIHLVISDVVMPEMGGAELAAKLVNVLPSARILFVSGYAGDALQKQGAFTKDPEFLHKPFTPSALSRKVRQMLDKAPQMADARIH